MKHILNFYKREQKRNAQRENEISDEQTLKKFTFEGEKSASWTCQTGDKQIRF
jgi:hypothetical protein